MPSDISSENKSLRKKDFRLYFYIKVLSTYKNDLIM